MNASVVASMRPAPMAARTVSVKGARSGLPSLPNRAGKPSLSSAACLGNRRALLAGRVSSPAVHQRAGVVVKAAADADKAGWTASSSAVILSVAYTAATAVAIPVVSWSLYSMLTTGCGLEPGPLGILSALEGTSYACIMGFVGWSLYAKATSGKGLEPGPYGLVGLEEGLAYLLTTVGVIIAVSSYVKIEMIPTPQSSAHCFAPQAEEVRSL